MAVTWTHRVQPTARASGQRAPPGEIHRLSRGTVRDTMPGSRGWAMAELFIPPGLRYECVQCGQCCRALDVWLTDPEARRLTEADLPEPLGPPGALVERRRGRGPQRWRIRPRPDGSCPFLTPDNLCLVHQRLGYGAKPFAGRLFPFTFVLTPVGTFVGARFECRAVVRGQGRPLEDLRPQLQELLEEYVRMAEAGDE